MGQQQPLLLLATLLFVLDLAHHGECFSLRGLLQLNTPIKSLLSGYMSNEQLAGWLQEYAQRCGHISKLTSFGRSSSGTQLYALEISNTPGQHTSKPELKYVANIHGDEPSGRQLLLALAEKMCAEYQSNSLVKRVVDSVHLHLIPTMNPDGFKTKRRENAASVDLNRNFPDPLRKLRLRGPHSASRDDGDPQPEVAYMMAFTLRHKFVASLALHEGAMVANYPMDGYPDGSLMTRRVKQASPDDATFVYMAKLYAQGHKTMAASQEFKGGITNGAQWYPLYGGMQDWNYLAAGCMELTLELNNDKWPKPGRLAEMWTENEKVLLEWPLAIALGGLHGSVVGLGPTNQAVPIPATIAVQGVPHNITASSDGKFHRVLAPGQYTILAAAPGYVPQSVPITILDTGLNGVTVNLTLRSTGAARTPLDVPKPFVSATQPSTVPQATPSSSTALPATQKSAMAPATQPSMVSNPQLAINVTRPSSSFLASNQKAIFFVALQVLIIGSFVAWRRGRINSGINSTSNFKSGV